MAADSLAYCLENITDYVQFERLCSDLMVLEGYDRLEPLGGFKDKGRDAVHVSSDAQKVATIFSYSVREDWRKKLDEDVEKVAKHGHKCNRIVYLSTTQPTNTERDYAIRDVKNTQGWDLDVYGLERLRTLLATRHQRVITRHPQLFPPPFFPQAGGVVIADSRDLILIDSHVSDEALATWLARRLRLEGYLVWCRGLAPIAGSSLGDTVEALLRHRTAQYVPLLSPVAIKDPDFSARRALAGVLTPASTIPVLVHAVGHDEIDTKTRQLEAAHFETSWSTGWQQILTSLAARQTPKASPDAPVVLRSLIPPGMIVQEPETIYSNRFKVIDVPKLIRGFSGSKKLTVDDIRVLQFEWPARRIDDFRLLSFVPPPKAIAERFQLKERGGAMWASVDVVEGVRSKHLASELIRKTMQAHWVARGLAVCPESGTIYFPEGLCKSDRLYFELPNGSKPFVGTYGRRKHWTPAASSYYRYHLSPRVDVKVDEDVMPST